jgi:hypothetical protein
MFDHETRAAFLRGIEAGMHPRKLTRSQQKKVAAAFHLFAESLDRILGRTKPARQPKPSKA